MQAPKPVAKKSTKKPKPRAKKTDPKKRLGILARLARIEETMEHTLSIVEFLEDEIIKARDAQYGENEKKIEAPTRPIGFILEENRRMMRRP